MKQMYKVPAITELSVWKEETHEKVTVKHCHEAATRNKYIGSPCGRMLRREPSLEKVSWKMII